MTIRRVAASTSGRQHTYGHRVRRADERAAQDSDVQKEHRAHLVEAQKQAQEDYDKTIVLLSGGAFGVSLAFAQQLLGRPTSAHSGWFLAAWISWGVSLLCTLMSFLFSHYALREALRRFDDGSDASDSLLSTATTVLNWLAGLAFCVGLAAMAYFVHSNLKGGSGGRNQETFVSAADSTINRPFEAPGGIHAPAPAQGEGVYASAPAPTEEVVWMGATDSSPWLRVAYLCLGFGGLALLAAAESRRSGWARSTLGRRRQLLRRLLITYGFGLLACGILLVSFFGVRADTSAATSSMNASPLWAIDSTLRSRLPTPEAADARNRALVEAIRHAYPPTPGQPSRLPAEAQLIGLSLLALVGLLLLLYGIVQLVGAQSLTRSLPALSVGTLLSLGSLISLGGVTLFDKLVISPALPREPDPSNPRSIYSNCGSVGPFVTARSESLETEARQTLAAVRGALVTSDPGLSLRGVLLVGSADLRELRGPAARAYGSNAGLAQARACWVRDQLSARGDSVLDRALCIPLSVGPSHVGLQLSGADLASDRVVTVYALWQGGH